MTKELTVMLRLLKIAVSPATGMAAKLQGGLAAVFQVPEALPLTSCVHVFVAAKVELEKKALQSRAHDSCRGNLIVRIF